MRTIELDAARQKIREAIAEAAESLAIVTAACAAAEPFNGKPVSKRIASAIESALPGYRVHYSAEHGFYRVTIWGGRESAVQYSNRVSLNLGYANAAHSRKPAGPAPVYIHAERLGRDLSGYSHCAERIAAGESLLVELPARVAAYNAAREAFEAAAAPLSKFGLVA
jgi:hypothetical protein